MDTESAEGVVQAQLEAYNSHNIKAFTATYASDAEIYEYPATLLMKGVAQIEEYYGTKRFVDPMLHATVEQRIVMSNIVVDYEKVVLNFPEGPGRMEAIAIYEVKAGRIAKLTLIRGKKTIDAR
jgi:hypothetical protein